MTPIAARLALQTPTVFVSDATFFVMADYNINFKRLSPSVKKTAMQLESTAIRSAIIATFPSVWAQSSALENFDADRATTFQIPWGANLLARNPTPTEDRPKQPWRLLFVGVDWLGKGGDILLRAFELLIDRGCEVELDVVGCAPSDPPPTIAGVTFHGFISKNTPEGRERLEDLFRRAHLFVLPTRFDAFPTVIAESASYGLPIISYRTGGLPSNVLHEKTGTLIEPDQGAEAFANAIVDLMSSRERYNAMATAAFRFSEDSLNWETWASQMVLSITRRLEPQDMTVSPGP